VNNRQNMKICFCLAIIALALAMSVIFIRESRAQSTGSQTVDNMGGGMMANGNGIATTQTNGQEGALVVVSQIPPGYRDWRLVSVAHEAGNLNDIRAILGNDLAINSYRDGKLPFPDGAMIARIAWLYVPSEENDKIFGRPQSFVPGAPPAWYLQFMVKDSKKFAATGGWGYGQFDKDGTPAPKEMMAGCSACHQAVKARDFVFTRYTP
jgi:Cytochrome P460